jgi:HTH-type transcriptional repressor of NAD biosynthesis genes
MFRHGFVLGKFYPPHAGHHHLIEAAANQSDLVTVLVLAHPRESISGAKRARWLQQVHRGARVIPVDCDLDVDYNSEEAWQAHIDLINKTLQRYYGSSWSPDAVFTSEDYGNELARRMNATHVSVDRGRSTFPISGTSVRRNVPAHWALLNPVVKRDLCQRIVIMGAESTGTTTLAQDLAKVYQCAWVPEYGRMYSEGVGLTYQWSAPDLVHIAKMQNQLEDQLAGFTEPVLICDTDALATNVWAEFLVDDPIPHFIDLVVRRPLYFVTSPEGVAFEDDGVRFGKSFRLRMHERFVEICQEHGLPWVLVEGGREERVDRASVAIDQLLLEEAWRYADPVTEPTVILHNGLQGFPEGK